ncbi:hypothetical protein QJS10_CPA03g01392 [Acorus calamus]|uniref:Uncharacterized protein n=1 Tax=Acorus calamus TaxID=4465 RepID=A0AAV9FAF3_ACOCL|nr:hypothetical protein QJS10_CPA03g01392 [Acorus calamus]
MEIFSPGDLCCVGGNRLSDYVAKPSVGMSGERESFWQELSGVKAGWNLPWCLMGDFNITRFTEDRNKEGVITGDMAQFSEWIAAEDMVSTNWALLAPNLFGIKKVVFKLKRLKLLLKRWNSAQRVLHRQQKALIELEVDMLDKNDEAAPISAEDRDQRIILKEGQSLDDPSCIEQAFVNYFSSSFKKNNSWAPEWRDEDLGRIPVWQVPKIFPAGLKDMEKHSGHCTGLLRGHLLAAREWKKHPILA